MKILLTGVTGYIGKRLLIQLLEEGHHLVCSVRDKNRFGLKLFKEKLNQIEVIENDFLDESTLNNIQKDIDAAYYLIHSMSSSDGDFQEKEKVSADNFRRALEKTNVKQVIFLTGIINEEKLSKHLQSRKDVEQALQSSVYSLTSLRAGIIVGSGSASFEIIRDLVEKLPVMITPIWLNTKCQPIAIRNVMQFLVGVLGKEFTYNQNYDIAGTDILTYKQMLLQYAEIRGLKRYIFIVPVMTPKLSSYWLYFVTSTSYFLAVNLVDSMKIDVVAKKNNLAEQLNIHLFSYHEAIQQAFDKIKQNDVLSSWFDSFSNQFHSRKVWQYLEVPEEGCFKDIREEKVDDEEKAFDRVFSIGGKTGWYYADFLWRIRGFLDKLFGGVGLRRGRRNMNNLEAGDSVDFWRVLYANREEKRLLLFAEMKLPGEAWLEFKIKDGVLHQEATFRPLGLSGRLYWYSVLPFHGLIFNGMLKKLAGK
ncbi:MULTISPECIES: SDR family oxidoreductase [unclassified Kaistella]|uniref:SDR family oxidoreductase n=1 Tax=unclassified Kaistella TaxID=2762626 RepID=UPI002736C26E|nr:MULTISPECIES: SDR family oxidoreductase [unclassified Kaistella]MDP2454122.1 SDR family oxidoreductase [Kaistella sp. SH11-4b]MDP2457179.1 SDR family oxidoreductase [Kaistella sp. SH40-3]MDP2459937.1 SDR family oxidoreductase [Kaistella sp. SH19-2b]